MVERELEGRDGSEVGSDFPGGRMESRGWDGMG